MPQEFPGLSLHKGEVSTTQDGLGLLERINLPSAGLFAHIKVLEQPIALSMERSNVLMSGHQLLGRGLSHHLFILFLRKFLFSLSLGHLCVKVFDASINHGNDSCALLRLLGVCLWCFWCCRRSIKTPMHRHLDKHGWLLVQLRVVELVQAVLGHGKDVLCCCIVGHQGGVIRVFLLALLSGLRDTFVQSCNASCQSCHLLSKGCNSFLGLGNGSLKLALSTFQTLFLVISRVKLHLTVLLLVVVILLLSFQEVNHVINHLQDLLEAKLLATDCQHDVVDALTIAFLVAFGSLKEGKSLSAHGL